MRPLNDQMRAFVNHSQVITHKKPSNARYFYWFSGLQVLLWTVLSTLTRNAVPADTLEGIAWGNQWQWGYNKHPFLAAWLSSLVTHLGGSIGWPVYLLSQVAVVACFWAVWQLAKKILNSNQALISVLLLETIWYYTLASVKFNPTTLMTPLWMLTALAFYNALKTQKTNYWLLTGFLSGLCMVTKYQSALFLACMLLLLLFTQLGRQSWKKPSFYAATILGALVVLPNVIWLMQHNYSAITYAFNRVDGTTLTGAIRHVFFPLSFFGQQLGTLAPFMLFAIPLYRRQKTQQKFTQFDKAFFATLGLGPLIITLLISGVLGLYLYSKWATPYFFFAGYFINYVAQARH